MEKQNLEINQLQVSALRFVLGRFITSEETQILTDKYGKVGLTYLSRLYQSLMSNEFEGIEGEITKESENE